jgi:hypothetical protein
MKSGRIFSPSSPPCPVLLAPATQAQEGTGKKKLAITKIAATDALTKRMAKQGVGSSRWSPC